MSTLLIKNIRTLVSCDSADTVYENVDLYAENGFIKAIGARPRPQGRQNHRREPYALLSRPRQHPPPPLSGASPGTCPRCRIMELFDWLTAAV